MHATSIEAQKQLSIGLLSCSPNCSATVCRYCPAGEHLNRVLQVAEGLKGELPEHMHHHQRQLQAAAELELACALQYYKRMQPAAKHLDAASAFLDVTLHVTGTLPQALPSIALKVHDLIKGFQYELDT